jgi:PIN domain nuclease of toxin-antitoxin system
MGRSDAALFIVFIADILDFIKYPRDPADRIIGATAIVEGMRLVTADKLIRQAKVAQTIW